MKRLLFGFAALLWCLSAYSQTGITFRLDKVTPAAASIGEPTFGMDLARYLHSDDTYYTHQDILAYSFGQEEYIWKIGEDALYKMLIRAWAQHRPVVLTPDAVWMVICQGFSHYINENSEMLRDSLVSHQGKKALRVRTGNLFSEQADWGNLIDGFVAEIDSYTRHGIASTLLADFSTTGTVERIASGITLMDSVKSYFDYIPFTVSCGIPSITLTGTPSDWKIILEKTRSLYGIGPKWWLDDLVPVLEEFVKASEGKPNYRFWKNIVSKTHPRSVRGPSCGPHPKPETHVDGWVLKLFPFTAEGRTPDSMPFTSSLLPETVCVPLKYEIVDLSGKVLRTIDLELVAGIVGVVEDPASYALTPKIGWLVRKKNTSEN